MDDYEWGVEYTLKPEFGGTTDVMSVKSPWLAQSLLTHAEAHDRVATAKIVKRPVGVWEDA